MVVWLRPEYILAIVTSLYYCSQLVSSKTYDRFYCATEEGHHQISCPDETALLTDVSIRKVYRRTETCAPDVDSDYLIQCQSAMDGSSCEGNKTCSIEVSSRNYIQCEGKPHAPTYFFVKYTCTQIHIMCKDTAPIRNTLYGFIVSPAYPHPMADDLKCSINIEADPSMYIELAPIQIRLQDAIKCRLEYLEVFGYLNSPTNNSSYDNTISNKDSKTIWKSYHTWCGAERSSNNPPLNSGYLISSNSLYMSLQTAASKKPRYFKIRYKVVPSSARSQYDSDGVAFDSMSESAKSSMMTAITSSTIISTTIVVPTLEENNAKNLNGTVAKRTYKKEILIGVIAGVILLVVAILAGIGVFLFIKRRRSSTSAGKSASSATGSTAGKKIVSSLASANNTALKPGLKSSDKAPLLDSTTNSSAPTTTKRKLVPERTVQISDVNTSRFKSPPATTITTTAATTAAVAVAAPGAAATTSASTTATAKDPSSGNSDAVATSSLSSAAKAVLTAADSGIYGADLSDEAPPITKIVASIDAPKIYGIDLPDKSEPASLSPPVTVVINPLSEPSTLTPENTTLPNIVVPNNVTIDAIPNEREDPSRRIEHLDETIRSAYSNLIDATMSENEGTIAGSSVVSSASQSRRTSNVKQPLLFHETNNLETIPRKPTPFNPLHVILKKDANKYYTTEYI